MSNSSTQSSDSVPHVNPSPKDVARFWKYVPEKPEDGCWHWCGNVSKVGYGRIWFNRKFVLAHRLCWVISFGVVPEKMCVLHKCDQRSCVNPDHLFIGTHQDNSDDMVRKGRQASGDRNGSRLHPERLARGVRSGAYTHPERIARGDRNGSRTRPDRLARGDRNGARLHPETRARGDRSGARLHPERLARGEDVNTAKLTESQVIEIRARCHGGENRSHLAAIYGVTVGTIYHIARRFTWKHVP